MPSSACKTCGSEEHTSELQSHSHLVCRLLLEKKKRTQIVAEARAYAERNAYYVTHSHSSLCHGAPRSSTAPAPGLRPALLCSYFFFFNDTATTEIYPLSLHDALPI